MKKKKSVGFNMEQNTIKEFEKNSKILDNGSDDHEDKTKQQ